MTKRLPHDERHEKMPDPPSGEPVEDAISAALRLLGLYKREGLVTDVVAHEDVVFRLRAAREKVVRRS